MTDRTERKLHEVAIARYGYRHEAEFAAGFLDDAGIPYRLQMDDPSMGFSMSTQATIWVRTVDLERARDVIEGDDGPLRLIGDRAPSKGSATRPRSTGLPSDSTPELATPPEVPSSHPRSTVPDAGRASGRTLPVRARALSVAAALALAALAPLAGRSVVGGWLVPALAVVAGVFFLVGVFGRAPGLLRDLLHGISGDAP